jgi:ABC-2 type transport system ATP-binding protein
MISIKGLSKSFGPLKALDDLTLEIGPGEVFGFIGPNGAGKSTTMKLLSCLITPDSGTASVCGHDIKGDTGAIRRSVGYMPDFLGVYDDLTVDEYLQFFAAAFKIPRKQRATIIGSVLELTDLVEKRHALVDSLSRGMQQRLGVARVLVHDPKVLLLDEPASGLDPRARIEMRSLLLELGRMGKALMVSSHILSELAEMCTSIGIIERGRLLYSGSIEDAFHRTRAMGGSQGECVVVTLEADSPPPSTLEASLAGDTRIATVKASDADRTLRVHLAAPGTSRHFIIERIAAAGGRIASFGIEEIKLEDAFLKLTTGALQ